MRKIFLSFLILGLTISVLLSCKKGGFTPISDNRPTTPVNVLNLYATYNVPVVAASVKDSVITIQLGIPSSSSNKIKEITRVVYSNSISAAATLLAAKVVNNTNVGIYKSNPIPGNGQTVTFTSSFPEYRQITSQTIPVPTSTNALLNRYFHFLITLDDGTQIITEPVRVYVTQ